MKIAYLILVHNTPNHTKEIINALRHKNALFFIHVDAKSTLTDYEILKAKDVTFIEPCIPVYWADFSQVHAQLSLVREALNDSTYISRFILISGACYPLRSSHSIYNYFLAKKTDEFMNLVEMPSDSNGKPEERLSLYWVMQPNVVMHLYRFIRRVLIKLHLLNRFRDYSKVFGDKKPYGGSAWWALTRNACKTVLDFYDSEKELVKFYKNVFCPDESFIHTAIGNSIYKKRVQRNLTFADWSNGGANPNLITSGHIRYFLTADPIEFLDSFGPGDALFARKFPDNSANLLKQLNNNQ